jgi:hypothetical protein
MPLGCPAARRLLTIAECTEVPGFTKRAARDKVGTIVFSSSSVLVARCRARVAGVEWVAITSGLSRTSSAARSGRRSNFPSAKRHSIRRFFPST